MSLWTILAKIPSAFHKIQPSLLVGVNPSGEPEVVATDATGKMLSVATVTQAGAGFTQEGDAITADLSGLTTDVYHLRVGGESGTIVETITVTWTNSNKNELVSSVRTIPT